MPDPGPVLLSLTGSPATVRTGTLPPERGHPCRMPLGFEARSKAFRRRYDQHRSVRQSSSPSPQPSPLRRGRHIGGAARLRGRPWLERRACYLPLPKGEGWGEGEARNRTVTTCEDEPCALEFRLQFLVALDRNVRAPSRWQWTDALPASDANSPRLLRCNRFTRSDGRAVDSRLSLTAR